jgi:hypothetical protein
MIDSRVGRVLNYVGIVTKKSALFSDGDSGLIGAAGVLVEVDTGIVERVRGVCG